MVCTIARQEEETEEGTRQAGDRIWDRGEETGGCRNSCGLGAAARQQQRANRRLRDDDDWFAGAESRGGASTFIYEVEE